MISAIATISRTLTATATITYTSPAGNCTYRNSNNSFNETILSGQTFIAPDVTFTDNLGVANVVPANESFASTLLGISYIQLGFPANPTIYTAGDAGSSLAAGVYVRSTAPGIRPILVDNDTLHASTPNAFGNLLVWTDSLGGTDFAGNGNYAINHYTGKGWYLVQTLASSWVNAMNSGNTSVVVGFNDWYVGTILEHRAIARNGVGAAWIYNYSPFNNTNSRRFWTSESHTSNPTVNAMTINNNSGSTTLISKTSGANYYYLTRNHY